MHRSQPGEMTWRMLRAEGTTYAKAQRFEWLKKGLCEWTILNGVNVAGAEAAEIGGARLSWASRPVRVGDTGAKT